MRIFFFHFAQELGGQSDEYRVYSKTYPRNPPSIISIFTIRFSAWKLVHLSQKGKEWNQGVHVASMIDSADPVGVQILMLLNRESASRNRPSQSPFSLSRELKRASMVMSEYLVRRVSGVCYASREGRRV